MALISSEIASASIFIAEDLIISPYSFERFIDNSCTISSNRSRSSSSFIDLAMFKPGAFGVTIQYLLLKINLFTTGVALPRSAWVAT